MPLARALLCIANSLLLLYLVGEKNADSFNFNYNIYNIYNV